MNGCVMQDVETPARLRTFDSVVPTPCQDSSAIHRKDHRTGLDTLSVCTFDRHAWSDKVRAGLPHVNGTIQTRCVDKRRTRPRGNPSSTKKDPGTDSLALTTANQIPIIRISTCSHLCPRSTLFRLDDNNRSLFPSVLHVPYPKTGKVKVSNRDQSPCREGEGPRLSSREPKVSGGGRNRCQGMDEWGQTAEPVDW